MRLSSLRWPLIGLVVIVVIGFLLTKGLAVGSSINVSMREGEGKFLYSKSCRYLYLDGLRDISRGSESPTREGAESTPCGPLGK